MNNICVVSVEEECGDPKINPNPPIDLNRVWFTEHAFEQFDELYWERYTRPFTPVQLLSWSREETAMPMGWEAKRTKRHHGERARYFIFGEWRFVITEVRDALTVVTFESKHKWLSPNTLWTRRHPESHKHRREIYVLTRM